VLLLGTTALAAGSLGGLVALWREKTFQAIALTMLFLVLYLCVIEAGGWLIPSLVDIDPDHIADALIALNPFRALNEVLFPSTVVVGLSRAALYGAIGMLGLSALFNAVGIVMLRVWNPSGEPIMQREKFGEQPSEPARIHAAPGRTRPVWANPILWREIATRAYGRRPLLVKTAYFVVLGLVCYYALFAMEPRPWAAAYGLVPIGILSLLLISAQSVTSITSERDLGSLDLLMITDLSPREFLLGKVFGILYNTKEFILPPMILIIIYATRGQFGTPPQRYPEDLVYKNVESAICAIIALAILMAFTVMLGIHVALRHDNSRFAAINTLGTVFFLSVGTLVCIGLILITGRFEYQWLSFAGFIIAGIGGLWWV
jgi:hypothetical protein